MNLIGQQAIVVGIDGSANSNVALDWAVAEATNRKLPLHVFGAGMRPLWAGESMYYDADSDAAIAAEVLVPVEERVNAAAVRARRLSPHLHVTMESSVGGAAGGLVELSSRAESVVVGRSGHGQVVGAILGSVALQVAMHAHCPVVVVEGSKNDDLDARGVVVGVDGSAVSELALGFAFEQASVRGVHLDVVHAWWSTVVGGLTQAIKDDQVNEKQLTLSEALVGWSEKYPDVEVRTSLVVGPTVPALTEAARNAQLLVVGSRGRGGFRSLLLGSVSQGVLAHAPCTIAVVRA